jgi:hypothetical protein
VIFCVARGGDMSTAAPKRRQRIPYGAISNEHVGLTLFALPEAGFDPGAMDGVYGFHTAWTVCDAAARPLGTVSP